MFRISATAGVALAVAVVISVVIATPAAAANPRRPPPSERPLTPAEVAASERRVADAEAYEAERRAGGADLATLSCPTPESTGPAGAVGCSVPQGFLGVEARDQVAGHYCGPAVGQVIANYSWSMKSGVNKYGQAKIAGWMKTDLNGLTNAPELEDGLEAATVGSPKRPADWDWVVTDLRDRDGDGEVGDEFHSYVRTNISKHRMPLAVPVKPHDPKGAHHLTSWAKPVESPGHWIGIYGWYGLWTPDERPRTYYTDSSKDEGGSTGKFWDPSRHVAEMMRVHTGRLVW